MFLVRYQLSVSQKRNREGEKHKKRDTKRIQFYLKQQDMIKNKIENEKKKTTVAKEKYKNDSFLLYNQ